MLRKEKWFKTVDGTKWTMDGTNFKGVVYKGAGLAEYGLFHRSLLREEEVH